MSTAFLKYFTKIIIGVVTSSRPFLDIKIPEGSCPLVRIFHSEFNFPMKLFSRSTQGKKLKFALAYPLTYEKKWQCHQFGYVNSVDFTDQKLTLKSAGRKEKRKNNATTKIPQKSATSHLPPPSPIYHIPTKYDEIKSEEIKINQQRQEVTQNTKVSSNLYN